MADDIQRTIYKLEIDDSGYIRGVENMSASTKRFAEVQNAANKSLQISEQALADNSEQLNKAKRDLDAYTGSDEKYRQQLTKTFNDAQANNVKLSGFVAQARKEYEAATKAAQDFASTSARANNLQQQPGARIAPQVQPSQPAALSAQLFNTINIPDLTAQAEVIARTKQEFDELRDSIQLAEERMKQLNAEDEEFKALAPIVEQGKIALQQYDNAAGNAGESTTSLRSQLRLAREELVKLEQAGEGTSQRYFELEKRTAKLTDEFNDQQQRIKILASDTKALDFGKGAITAATAAFSAYTSISVLAGGASEELQKKTLQLFAAMQLLQSLEQLSNLTRREGVLATLAQSGAQAAYTAVVGASTGALRVFKIALATIGVGAIIAGIVFLVNKFKEYAAATEKAAEQQKLLTEINEEAIKSFTSEVTHLTLIKSKLDDLNIPQKERIRLAKEYNKTAEEGNKIDLKQIDNIALVNQAIDTQIKKIEERARAKAAENVLTKRFEELFLAQEKARIEAEKIFTNVQNISIPVTTRATPTIRVGDEIQLFNAKTGRLEKVKATQDIIDNLAASAKDANIRLANQLRKSNIDQKIQNDPDVIKAQDEVNKALAVGFGFINTQDLIKPDFGKDTKDVENVFAQKLKDLQAKLAEVTAKSFESEGTIRKQFAASLEKEITDLQKLVTDKKLTTAQSEILIQLTTKINDVQLNEALDQFNKKVTDARQKLNDEINNLQKKNTEDQIILLQDEFERRRQLIDFNEKQQLEDSQKNTSERLSALEAERNLIGEQQYQDAKNAIVQAGEDEQTNIVIKAAQDRQRLAADSFKKQLEFFENIIKEIDLSDDEESAKRIRAASDNFLSGKIKYEQFQKDLEKIQIEYAAKKRNRDLIILKGELESLDYQIKITEDKTSAHYQELLRLRQELADKIAGLESSDAIKDAEDRKKKDAERKEDIQKFVAITDSIGQLADATVQFWQKANEAESTALDRSIALQEKRVDAAQRIAERGNAQYLKAEEDRLKELQVARENAARKQLGIDAALQASQILTGITGAIAKIATPGIGIAETIGAIAVIVGSLATGYALVKSLQGNQPRLATGTEYVKREGQPAGIDTIPAWLNEGEAVIPTDKNKAYHPTIKAVYDGSVPAETLNEFVKNYTTKNVTNINEFVTNNHKIKHVPQVNYNKIKEVAELKMGTDGKMAIILSEHSQLLKENNELQKQILKRKIHVENKIDRDGVASMVTDYLTQKEIDKRV